MRATRSCYGTRNGSGSTHRTGPSRGNGSSPRAATPTTTSRTTVPSSRGPRGLNRARRRPGAERAYLMPDRTSYAFISFLTMTLIVAGAAAPEGEWRREVDALRPRDVADRAAAVLDNLERRSREALTAISRSDTSGAADRAR